MLGEATPRFLTQDVLLVNGGGTMLTLLTLLTAEAFWAKVTTRSSFRRSGESRQYGQSGQQDPFPPPSDAWRGDLHFPMAAISFFALST
jgi:hypothetical protein